MTEDERKDRLKSLRLLTDRYVKGRWSLPFIAFLESRMDQLCNELMDLDDQRERDEPQA